MMCRMIRANSLSEWLAATAWLSERAVPDSEVEQKVRDIIAQVRERGDDALESYTKEFDCPDFKPPFRVSEKEIARAAASVSVEIRSHITAAACQIREFHQEQIEKSWFTTRPDGVILGQRVLPIEQAGLYVPGGTGGNTPLVSSLLMNAIPAQVAGCSRIAAVTPPRRDGTVNPYILAAAHLLDLDEVYAVGGAWAIAALAFGTRSIKAVDIIAGPGNIYVATAKRLLQGQVGIDMVAGPSEVLILADAYANPIWVAADMLSQAEHDQLASAICVTTDQRMADAVHSELTRQAFKLPRTNIAVKSLEDWGCIAVVPDMFTAVAIVNAVAPEHLEVCARNPWDLLPVIRNAGAIFLGQHTPEPVGDYYAGPNHVLPTQRTARFSSGLSVQTFCKKSNIISVSGVFLRESAADITALARLEGLEAHARSVEARLMARNAQKD